jgi:hypothetical protein
MLDTVPATSDRHTAIKLSSKLVSSGAYASERLPQRNREDCAGRVMVANRTREMRPSGMTRGAYGNVDYGKG